MAAPAAVVALLLAACSSSAPPGTVTGTLGIHNSAATPVAAFDRLWIPEVDRGRVAVVDPAAARIEQEVAAGDYAHFLAAGCGGYTVHQLTPGSFLLRSCDLPIAVAAGAGLLWVARDDRDEVQGLDPRTFSLRETVPVGLQPWAMTAAGPDLWVTDYYHGGVAEVDMPGGRVVATVPGLPDGTSALAAGAGAVWVSNSRFGLLYKINPATARVVDVLHLDYRFSRPLPVVVAFGSVWVRLESARLLLRIDPRTDRVLAQVPVGIFYGRDGDDALGADATGIWVSGLVTEHVSAARNAVDRKLEVTSATLAVAFGSLWALDIGGPLRRIAI